MFDEEDKLEAPRYVSFQMFSHITYGIL